MRFNIKNNSGNTKIIAKVADSTAARYIMLGFIAMVLVVGLAFGFNAFHFAAFGIEGGSTDNPPAQSSD